MSLNYKIMLIKDQLLSIPNIHEEIEIWNKLVTSKIYVRADARTSCSNVNFSSSPGIGNHETSVKSNGQSSGAW